VRKIKHEAIPEWAQGLYYNKGFSQKRLGGPTEHPKE
jgi:hypothetical protein